MKPTYTIAPDKTSIQCLHCGSVSHNPSDIHHRYCGRCGVFHGDLEPCMWCDEAVFPDEDVRFIPHLDASGFAEKKPWHSECLARSILGGINHQKGLCSCCGGTLPPDPPELTVRQVAAVALEYAWGRGHARACDQEAPQEVPPAPPRQHD